MLRFETSCAKRSLHNKYGNVICAKRSFLEKKITTFFQIIIFRATKKIFKIFFSVFSVLLVKLLNIVSNNCNRNINAV